MEIELINQDIKNYLNKYTRFMSKKIYITKKNYDKFTGLYDYIYEDAENSIINYNEMTEYKKLLSIKKYGYLAVKRHNKKYLDEVYNNNIDYFKDNIKKRDILLILCEDDYLVALYKNKKDIENVIKYKINYLEDRCNIDSKKICVISNNIKINNIDVYKTKDIESKLYNNKKIILDRDKYNILSNYIKNILYKDKKKFKNFYLCFSDKLYFNKDILDFETFNDYHNYMYKRKMKNTKLDKSLYVKEQIKYRLNNLCGIDLVKYDNIDMAMIANTLFCSNINYEYIKDDDKKYFKINNNDIYDYIEYCDTMDATTNNKDNIIRLYSDYDDGTNSVEHLIYELVKKRYPIEKKGYEELYDILKDNSIDNYFKKFIDDIMIPFINIVKGKNYDIEYLNNISSKLDTKNRDKFLVLVNIYSYYMDYINSNNLIDNNDIDINMLFNKYKYIIIDNYDDSFRLDIDRLSSNYKILLLNKEKKYNYSYLIPNVKLYCEFMEYIKNNKLIPISNTYSDINEMDNLAIEFTINNIDVICNSYGENITKKKFVDIYIYDDSNRLKIDVNRNNLLYDILKNISSGKNMIMGRDIKDIEYLLMSSNFSYNDHKINYDNKCIDYLVMDTENINFYDMGILINPMDSISSFNYDKYDYYLLRILDSDRIRIEWEKKIFYSAISRVRNKLIILCGKSYVNRYIREIANHNEVRIKKEIYTCDD